MTNLEKAATMTLAEALGCPPDIILLGRDEAGKAHASRFDGMDGNAAKDAASIMGMAALAVVGDELTALADKLPKGKLYDSGKAFVPFVKGELYERLHDHLPKKEKEALAEANRLRQAAARSAKEPDVPETLTLPEDWSKIAVDSLVLAYDGSDEAWFEAFVVEMRGSEEVMLRWLNRPDLPNFMRRRDRLALLHPSHPMPVRG